AGPRKPRYAQRVGRRRQFRPDLVCFHQDPALTGGPGAVPRHPASTERPGRGTHPPSHVILRDHASAGSGGKASGPGGDKPRAGRNRRRHPNRRRSRYPYLGLDGLIGMYGPRGMSMALRESIAADVRAVVEADPTIASRLAQTGQVVDLRGPREFAAGIKEIRDQLAAIAQTLGMKPAQ